MEFVASARQIGEQLLSEAHEASDGSLTWRRGADRRHDPVADSGPFNGRCGEALLMAGLHAATGDPRWEEAALRVLLTLRQRLPDPAYRTELAARLDLGLSGLAGILYALVRVAGLLHRPELLESAGLLATVFTSEAILEERRYDIIWGSAGAILGLLALADAGSQDALRRADQCASHLLTQRSVDPVSGRRAWNTLRAIPSSGFAHGAGGIAHALLQVHRRTGRPELLEAALEAFAFERTLFREDRANWEDSRAEPQGVEQMWSWCHGGPGIALARLGVLDLPLEERDEKEIAGELRQALVGTIAGRAPAVDTLCCGYFGRIDILLEAGQRLGNPSLLGQARRIATARLERAAVQGFLLTPDEDVPTHLGTGFWQGLGGTAYTLLRLADPERFPCVLSMA